MNENSDLLPNLLHEEFEMQMRGYSRRQVDDFVARRNNEIRELEQRLARTLDETEHLRREISTVRAQALSGRPAHEEISERISQILKLADDEAKAQKNKADDDIAKLRADAQQESDRVRADAREQAERLLTAAQEQAERTISASRNEAEKTRTAARTDADRLTSDTRKKADAALANAKAQAKKVLDEATARATAIHDGAERRLNLLSTRHTETVRRLTDILDGVQGLVAAEAARMSLEEEVNQTVAKAVSMMDTPDAAEANGGQEPPDLELALLAPPAPETLATGAGAPPRNGDGRERPAQPGRPGPGTAVRPGAPGSPLAVPGTVGGGTSAAAGHVSMGRPSQLPPPPGMSGGPARLGGTLPDRPGGSLPERPGSSLPERPGSSLPERPGGSLPERPGGSLPDSGPRATMPIPTGPPRPGPPAPGTAPSGSGLGDGMTTDRDRDLKRDPNRSTGLIDPDEPTEGLRIVP
jgi:cell division septum initiation protein DivIVA